MNRNSAFFQRSVKVAERFLHTALVIDDRAFQSSTDSDPPPSEAQAPPTPSTIEPAGTERSIEARESGEKPVVLPPPEHHRLDAQAVIDGFAQRGIVCAVLKRQPEDRLENPDGRLSNLASVADILVLDWTVHTGGKESAEETLNLVETALRRNADQTPQQMRLIAIYTGELNLATLTMTLRKYVQERLGPVNNDGDFAFTKGAVRVVVLGKKTVSGRGGDAKEQEVDFGELALRTIVEFATMTAGLVSNVALDSLARLRCATHRILTRFSTDLDAAFLVHRSLLDKPEEADNHLATLIAAELLALIEEQVEPISGAVLADWLAERQSRVNTYRKWGFPDANDEGKWLQGLSEKGYKETMKAGVPEQLTWVREIGAGHGCTELDQLIELIGGTARPGANEELAMLMAVKTRYSDDLPHLTLGTIVLHEHEGLRSFWLCLQPTCDSLRLTSSRSFPMLKLAQSNERFGVVIKVDDAFVRLRIDPRPFKVRTVEFRPNKTARVVLPREDQQGRLWFESKDPQFRCRWIAELKFEQAQRAAQSFATQNSRVGLTESEWQRRWDIAHTGG